MASDGMAAYLAHDKVVDWQDERVRQQAEKLRAATPLDTARRCYEFVRDEVAHSLDIGASELGCSASEVLQLGHGYSVIAPCITLPPASMQSCYAKAHLLAALLRANGIPAGFDYQRLGDGEGGFVLHGITTVYLPELGWYRIDARGNKPGIDAQCTPPQERLAWRGDAPGELNYRLNLVAPYPAVVAALRRPLTVQQLLPLLPGEITAEDM